MSLWACASEDQQRREMAGVTGVVLLCTSRGGVSVAVSLLAGGRSGCQRDRQWVTLRRGGVGQRAGGQQQAVELAQSVC